MTSVVPEAVVACMPNINIPTFNPTSAYNCLLPVPVYYRTTTMCAPAVPTVATNAVVNRGFETGNLNSWELISWDGSNTGFGVNVATTVAQGGSRYAMRVAYNNALPAFSQYKQLLYNLEPRSTYEASCVSFIKSEPTLGKPTCVWTNVTQQFVPNASFSWLLFTISVQAGGGPGHMYVDNIGVRKIFRCSWK
ncbi:hypothetical protein B0H63DRAFT_515934 [Podospora didyma]|uniref:Uncharacterized protein n=1 Tax=Podospora didyma TaxID=330526 RepID=A0AAE0P3N7_9PEZI|nr:hypothetical protein B0H63DRAFT_515934 [Podospora didyma]